MRKLSLFLLLWMAVLAGSVALLPGPAGAAGNGTDGGGGGNGTQRNGTSPQGGYVGSWGYQAEILMRHVQTYDFPDPVFVFELRAYVRFDNPRFETNIGEGVVDGELGGATATLIRTLEIQCRKSAGRDCSPEAVIVHKATARLIDEDAPEEPMDITPFLRSGPTENRRFMIFKKGPLPPATEVGSRKERKGTKQKQEILVYHDSVSAPNMNDYSMRLTFPEKDAGEYSKVFLMTSEGPTDSYAANQFNKRKPTVWNGWLAWGDGHETYPKNDPITGKRIGTLYEVNGFFYDLVDGGIDGSRDGNPASVVRPAPFPWITIYEATAWTKKGRKVDLLPFLVEDPFTPLPVEVEGTGLVPTAKHLY